MENDNIDLDESMSCDEEDKMPEVVEPLSDQVIISDAYPNKNALYYFLSKSIMGRFILGNYAKENILAERKLIHHLIPKVMEENPISHKIKTKRFEEIRDQLSELFPTVPSHHLYTPRTKNVKGEVVNASGSLYNFYRKFRPSCIKVGAIEGKLKPAKEATTSTVEVLGSSQNSDLKFILDEKQSHFSTDLFLVTKKWHDSFESRLELLVERSNKVIIRSTTYLNSFWCLRNPIGLSLLIEDSVRLVEHLKTEEIINETVVNNFRGNFVTIWSSFADALAKIGDDAVSREMQQFKFINASRLNSAPNSIKALLYLPYLLTKATNVKTSGSGTISLDKHKIAGIFISTIDDESKLKEKKKEILDQLKNLEIPVHPFVIFCGEFDSMCKAYVVISNDHYEFQDPILAVDGCFKACVALHTWPSLLINVYAFLQVYVYEVPNGKHIAFVTKVIKSVEKLKGNVEKFYKKSK